MRVNGWLARHWRLVRIVDGLCDLVQLDTIVAKRVELHGARIDRVHLPS